MKKVFVVILSLFIGLIIVKAKPVEYEYTEWFSFYPEGVEEIRIESEDRYKWFKIENDERIETEEYYNFLEGYEKIEESKKTFYRVINSKYIILGPRGEVVYDSNYCIKIFCTAVAINPYVPPEENPPEEPIEEIVNPNTSDPLHLYYYSFIVAFVVLIIVSIARLFIVLSLRKNNMII